MFFRAIVVWALLLLTAVANGGVREGLLIPKLGARAGHVISTLTLSAAILLLTWLFRRWLNPPTTGAALLIGAFWVSLTLAFEFLGGHY